MSANFKSSKDILRAATSNLQKEEKNSRTLELTEKEQENSLVEYNREEDGKESNSLINLTSQFTTKLDETNKSIISISQGIKSLNETTKAYVSSKETINALLGSSLVSLGNITSVLSAFRADFIMIKNGQNINGEGYYRKELIPKLYGALPKISNQTLSKVINNLKNAGNFANVMSNAVRSKVGNNKMAGKDNGEGIISKLMGKFLPSGAKDLMDQMNIVPMIQQLFSIDDTNIASLAGSLMGNKNKQKFLDPLSQWTADTIKKGPGSGGKGLAKFMAAQFLQNKTGLGEGDEVAPKEREKNPNLVWSALAPFADDIKDMVKTKYEAFKKTPSFFKKKVPYATPVWIINSKVQKNYLNNTSTDNEDRSREKLKNFIKGLNTNVKDEDGNLLFKYDPITNEFSGKLADEYLQTIGLEDASYEEKLKIIKNIYDLAIEEKDNEKYKNSGSYVEKDEQGNFVKKEFDNKAVKALRTKDFTGLDKVANMFSKGIFGLFDLKSNGGIKQVFQESKSDISDFAKSVKSTFTGHKSGRKKRSKNKKNKQQRVEIATLHEGEIVRNSEEQNLQDNINQTVTNLNMTTANVSTLIYLNQLKVVLLSKYFKKEKINPSDLPDNEIDLNFIVSKNKDSKKSVDYFVNVNKKVKEQIKGKSEEDVPNKSFFRRMLDWFLGKEEEEDENSDEDEESEDKDETSDDEEDSSSAEPSEDQENEEEQLEEDSSSAEPSEDQENEENKEEQPEEDSSSAEPSEDQNQPQEDPNKALEEEAENKLKEKQEQELKDLEKKQDLKLRAKKFAKEKYLWAKEKAGKLKNLAIEKAGKLKNWAIKKASKVKQRMLKYKGVIKSIGKKMKNLVKKLTKRLKRTAKRIIARLAKSKLAATVKQVGRAGGKVLQLIGKGIGAVIKAVKNIPIYGKVAAVAASIAGVAAIAGGLIKLKSSIKKGKETKEDSSKEIDKINKKSNSKLKKAKNDAEDEKKKDEENDKKDNKEDQKESEDTEKEDQKDGSSNPKGVINDLNRTDKEDQKNSDSSKAKPSNVVMVEKPSDDNDPTNNMDKNMKNSFGKFADGQFAKNLLKNPEKGANMLFSLTGGTSILNLAKKGTNKVINGLKKATNVASSGFSGLLTSAMKALKGKTSRTDDIGNKKNGYSENVDLAYAQYNQAKNINNFVNAMSVGIGLSEISDEKGNAIFTSTLAKQQQAENMKGSSTGSTSSSASPSINSSSSSNSSDDSSAPNRTTSTKKGDNANKAYKEYVLNHSKAGYYDFLCYYLNKYTDKDNKRTTRMDKAFYEDLINSTPYNKLAKNKENFDRKLRNKLDKSVFGKGIVRGINGKGFTNNQMTNEFLNASGFALNNNYKEQDGGTYPRFFKDYLNKNNIDVNSTGSNKEILSNLSQGNPVILMGKDSSNSGDTPYGSEPHYVVATGYDGKNITVEDSESKTGSNIYNANQVLSHSNIKMTTNSNKKYSSKSNSTYSPIRQYKNISYSTNHSVNKNTNNYFKSGKSKYGRGYNEIIQANQELLKGAQDGWTMYGILASVTLAQAIEESGFGTSNIAKQANNWFGHSFNFGSDKYKVGKYTSSSGREWAKYATAGDSFRDHAYVLSGQSGNTRYAAAVGESDPLKAITAIENGGYCEGNPQTYINKIYGHIQKYNLTQYDVGSYNGTAAGGSSGYSNWLFCGDSRTVGLKNADSSLETIAEVGKGYNFFISKQSEIESKSGYNIVLWFGVNDLGNCQKYIQKYNEIAKNMSGKSKIIACTVGPCEDKYNDDRVHGGSGSVKKLNTNIEKFNSSLSSGLSSDITIVDLYTFIKSLMGSGTITNDCLHYDNETSKKIIEKIKSSIGTSNNNSASSSASVSGGQYLGDVQMNLTGYVDATETLSKYKKSKGIWDKDESEESEVPDETSTATPSNNSPNTSSTTTTPTTNNNNSLDTPTTNNINQELNNITGNNTPTNSLVQGDTTITDVYKKGGVTYVVNSVEYGEKANIKEILDYFNELNDIQDDSLDVLEIIYKKLLKRKGKNVVNVKQALHFDLRETKTI